MVHESWFLLYCSMSDYLNISDFLSPVNFKEISQDEDYRDGQIGKVISVYKAQKYPAKKFPELDDAQLVIVGCGEQRGSGLIHGHSEAPDLVRRQLYSLYYWHQGCKDCRCRQYHGRIIVH